MTGFALIAREKLADGRIRKHYICPCLFSIRENAEHHLAADHAKIKADCERMDIVSIAVESVNSDDDRDVWRSFDKDCDKP